MDKKELSGLSPHPPKRLVIDRSRWLRGEGNGVSVLFRPTDGKRCCLGSFGNQICGLSDESMARVPDPRRHRAVYSAPWPEWLFGSAGGNSEDAGQLMTDNDSGFLPEHERERRIAAGFAKHGVEVVFVDGPVADSAEGEKP